MSDLKSNLYFNQLLDDSFISQSITKDKALYAKICDLAIKVSRRELEREILKHFNWQKTKKLIKHIHIKFRRTNTIKFLSEELIIETPICPHVRKIKHFVKVDYYNTVFQTTELNRNFKKYGKDYLPIRKQNIIEKVKETGDLVTDPLRRAYGCFIHYMSKENNYIMPLTEFAEILNSDEILYGRDKKLLERCKAVYNGLHKRLKSEEVVFLYDPLPFLYEFKRFAREGFNIRPPDHVSLGESDLESDSEYDSANSVVNTDLTEEFSRFYGNETFPEWNRNEVEEYSSDEEESYIPDYSDDDDFAVTDIYDID